MFDYENCTKDSLNEYAETLGLSLDLRRSIDYLKSEVKAREAITGKPVLKEEGKPEIKWLKSEVSGRVFDYTQALFDYGLKPCDENGNLL